MPSANSNTGRSAGIWSSQDGSVAEVATRWYPVAGRKDLLAQRDYGRIVDVVPLHARAGIQPEHPAVQTASEVDHSGSAGERPGTGAPRCRTGRCAP